MSPPGIRDILDALTRRDSPLVYPGAFLVVNRRATLVTGTTFRLLMGLVLLAYAPRHAKSEETRADEPAASPAAIPSPLADGYRVKWTDRRIRTIKPGPQDRHFEQVGWVPTIGQALELAQLHHRPVFLFTHSGHINSGRC